MNKISAKPATVKVSVDRGAKVYVNDEGVEVHRLGYSMAAFLYGLANPNLKNGEELPEGIISATGDGDVPGQRKHLFADALLIGYIEIVVDKRRRNGDSFASGERFVRLTDVGLHAAKNHEVIGVEPPIPMSRVYAKMDRAIERERKTA